MAKADFTSFLKVKADTIERPRPLPNGHYYADFIKWEAAERNFAPKGEPPKMTPLVTCSFKVTAAADDVEGAPTELGQVVTRDYTLNDERGRWGLRAMAEDACGVPAKGLDLDELLDAALKSNVKVFNEQRAGRGEDADSFYNNITRVLNAND